MLSSMRAARTSAAAMGWLPAPWVRCQSSRSESACSGVSMREMWVSSCESSCKGRSVEAKVLTSYSSGSVGRVLVLAARRARLRRRSCGVAAAGDHGLVGGGDVGVRGLGQVGEKDMVPDGGAGGGADVLNVEDVVLEVLVEDAGLDLERGLRGLELVFQLEQSCARRRARSRAR